jgi:hypothetical protein
METTSDWENWYLHAGKDWCNVLIAEVPAGLDKLTRATLLLQSRNSETRTLGKHSSSCSTQGELRSTLIRSQWTNSRRTQH